MCVLEGVCVCTQACACACARKCTYIDAHARNRRTNALMNA